MVLNNALKKFGQKIKTGVISLGSHLRSMGLHVEKGIVTAAKWAAEGIREVTSFVNERVDFWNSKKAEAFQEQLQDGVRILEETKKAIDEELDHEKYKRAVLRRPEYQPEKEEKEMARKCAEALYEEYPNGLEELKEKSVEERAGAIRRLARKVSDKLDAGINDVIVEDIPAAIAGAFDRETRDLSINGLFLQIDETLGCQVSTVFHELTHAVQWDAVNNRNIRGFSFELLNAWSLNLENYISPYEGDEFYTKQPVEASAFWLEQEVERLYIKLCNENRLS